MSIDNKIHEAICVLKQSARPEQVEAIKAIADHLSKTHDAPEGMVVVPIEPTARMLLAGHRNGGQDVSCGRIWDAMVGSRPVVSGVGE